MLKNNRYLPLALSVLLWPVLFTGCVSPGRQVQPEAVPSYQRLQTTAVDRQPGAIYHPGRIHSLYEDVKARRIGDILTVLLVEKTAGQNSSDNSVNQATAMSVATPTFGGSSRPNMAIDLGSENSFSGQSGSSQSNSLSGSIAVTVHQILPNGNLVIEGEKWVQINQGREYIRLQGVIRPRDIDAFNTLYSTQVADARISYGGTGNNARGNNPGWAAKVIFSPLWPF